MIPSVFLLASQYIGWPAVLRVRRWRKAKRATRRGEVPATETVTPAPKKAAPKALAESTAPAIDVTHEEVQADVAPMRDKEADALHFNSEAKLRGQVHRAKELAKQVLWRP